MQRAKTRLTIPSGLWLKAWTGHTFTHGGWSHCWQGRGVKRARTSGNSPSTSGITSIHVMRRLSRACCGGTTGTLFSALQATTQAWHPVHRSRSTTMPQRAMYTSMTNDQCQMTNAFRMLPLGFGHWSLASRDPDSRGQERGHPGQMIRLAPDNPIGVRPPRLRPAAASLVSGPVGERHHLRVQAGVEAGAEAHLSRRRLHPDRLPVADAEGVSRLGVDVYPSLPGAGGSTRRDLREPGLIHSAAPHQRHGLVRDEMQGEFLGIAREPRGIVVGQEDPVRARGDAWRAHGR